MWAYTVLVEGPQLAMRQMFEDGCPEQPDATSDRSVAARKGVDRRYCPVARDGSCSAARGMEVLPIAAFAIIGATAGSSRSACLDIRKPYQAIRWDILHCWILACLTLGQADGEDRRDPAPELTASPADGPFLVRLRCSPCAILVTGPCHRIISNNAAARL